MGFMLVRCSYQLDCLEHLRLLPEDGCRAAADKHEGKSDGEKSIGIETSDTNKYGTQYEDHRRRSQGYHDSHI